MAAAKVAPSVEGEAGSSERPRQGDNAPAEDEGAADEHQAAEEEDKEEEAGGVEGDQPDVKKKKRRRKKKQQTDRVMIQRRKVESERVKLTGLDREMLHQRLAETKAAEDAKNHVLAPTAKQLETRAAMELKTRQKRYADAVELGQASYKQFQFHEETVELDLSNRGYNAQELAGLAQLLVMQGASEDPEEGSLTTLILAMNQLRAAGVAMFCEALEWDKNRKLVYLDLSGCSIGAEGAAAVAEMLVKNDSLLDLRLADNQLGHKGVKVLADALPHNGCLERLSLQRNCVFDAGCQHLAAVKFGNLVQLDLRGNCIGNRGCEYLAQELTNSFVRRLNLRDNQIGEEGFWAMGRMLKAHRAEFKVKEKERKRNDKADYVRMTPEEAELAVPRIDFDGLPCKDRPILSTYVGYGCGPCCVS